MSPAPSPSPQRGFLARLGNFLLWYILPGIAIVAVIAYIAAALMWHVNPPVVPVAGGSMRPVLQPGDLVTLRGVEPSELKKGDIIAFQTPESARRRFGLPESIVHRIIKVEKFDTGVQFQTQGDANSGPDEFDVKSGDVLGRMESRLAGWGYPLLFMRSRQGLIFLAAVGLVVLLYFALGMLDERKAVAMGNAISAQVLLAETLEIREALGLGKSPRAPPGMVAAISPEQPTETTAVPADLAAKPVTPVAPGGQPSGFDWLARRVEDSAIQSEQVGRTMRDLVGAVGEYGRHLQSHTDVMKNLALTTAELQRATEAMRALFERGGAGAEPMSLQGGLEDDQGMPTAPFDGIEPIDPVGEAAITPPPDLLLVPPPPQTVPSAPAASVPPAPAASVPPAPERVPRPPRSGPPPPPRTRPPEPE